MSGRYISFDAWWGGFNNIRMTYELAAAISVITNRTLILPPKIYCLFLSQHQDKNSFFDFWELFDKDAFTSQFNCIDYKDVPEYSKYSSDKQYFDGICNDIKCLPEDEHTNWGPGKEILHRSLAATDLYHEDQFIHFPRNLFGHWYYLLYMPNPRTREVIKYKLKHGLKFKERYNTNFFHNNQYNAIHVRSGDFNQTRKNSTENLFENLYEKVSSRLTTELPLYIATDEKDKTKFECLKGYKYYFLDSFIKPEPASSIAIETLICAKAEEFYGTRFSTFTDYINILRYYNNKKDCSKTLLNYEFSGDENYSWENCFVTEY